MPKRVCGSAPPPQPARRRFYHLRRTGATGATGRPRLIPQPPSHSSRPGAPLALPRGVPARARAVHADLAYAAGGALTGRVPRGARAARLPRALPFTRRGGRGDRHGGGAARRRRRDHLCRHPPRPRADGRRPRVHARRRSRHSSARADRRRRRPSRRGRRAGPRLRVRGGAAGARGAAGGAPPDRLRGRTLHARLVPGRRRRVAHLRAHQDPDARRPGRVAGAHGSAGRDRRRVPECPDRLRCRRRAALRQLGRLPRARGLPRARPAPRPGARRRGPSRYAGHPLRDGDRRASRGDAGRRRRRDRPRLARRSRRGVGAGRPRRRRAGEPRSDGAPRAARGDPRPRGRDPRTGGGPARARLQPRSRHPAADPGRSRPRARRRRARALRTLTMADAVLLLAFGGPERPEEIRPFLARVARGRPIPPERLEEVAHHYEAIGGRSPLNELTLRQARKLEAALAASGRALPVHVGLRHAAPHIADALVGMADAGVRRAVGVVLSPHASEASRDRYVEEVDAARVQLGERASAIRWAPSWHTHPLFVTAVADATVAALVTLPAARRADAAVVFTAHSIPVAMAERSPYVAEIEASARAVATQLGARRWQVAYQSRSGSPREPWLEPDVNDALRALRAEGVSDVVVVPVGFVCDHVEVLYDLDVEARATAAAVGLGFARAGAVNDHPLFIRMLAEVVAGEADASLQVREAE